MRTHSPLRRSWSGHSLGPAPHRHHRLIALVVLLVLVLLALPLLGQHSHAPQPQHHAALSVGSADCAHHHDQTPSTTTDCHCVHACAGALSLAFAHGTSDRDYAAAAPQFAQPSQLAPTRALSPPYRPPTHPDRLA